MKSFTILSLCLFCALLQLSQSTFANAVANTVESDSVRLRLNLQKGQQFDYVAVVDQKVSHTIPTLPRPVANTTRTSFALRLDVLEVEPDGTSKLRLTYRRAALSVKSPQGLNLNYDSLNSPQHPHPAMAGISALAGQSLVFTVSPQGKTQKVEGVEKILDRVFANLPLPAEAVKEMRAHAEKSIGTQTSQAMGSGSFPEEPVAAGSRWTNENSAAHVAPVLVKTAYTLVSRATGESLIGLSSEVRPNIEAEPLKMMGMTAKYYLAGNQKGSMRVDEATGLTKCFQMEQRLDGPIMITRPVLQTNFVATAGNKAKSTTQPAVRTDVSRIYVLTNTRGWLLARR